MSRKEMEVSNLVACSAQTKRDPKAYTKGSKWWFIKKLEVLRSLQNPCAANISKNRLYYYFDDFDNTNV